MLTAELEKLAKDLEEKSRILKEAQEMYEEVESELKRKVFYREQYIKKLITTNEAFVEKEMKRWLRKKGYIFKYPDFVYRSDKPFLDVLMSVWKSSYDWGTRYQIIFNPEKVLEMEIRPSYHITKKGIDRRNDEEKSAIKVKEKFAEIITDLIRKDEEKCSI